MAKIINPCQSAFISGRSISDNIILCHDLVKGFHLNRGKQRLSLKHAITKAFDSVNWSFIEAAMHSLNFPGQFIHWIMECVKSPSFSLLVNGQSFGFFKSTRGLHQGCPLSPYLFYKVMEFLLANLNSYAKNGSIPIPFPKGNTSNSHLPFIDDVMISALANIPVAGKIKDFLEKFRLQTGLTVNCSKSPIKFSNCDEDWIEVISSILNFPRQSLAIKYLGLPLFSTRLKLQQCQPILEKIHKKEKKYCPSLEE